MAAIRRCFRGEVVRSMAGVEWYSKPGPSACAKATARQANHLIRGCEESVAPVRIGKGGDTVEAALTSYTQMDSATTAAQVLVVEDEANIRELVSLHLR